MRLLHINCNYIGTTLHQLMVEQLERLGYNNQVYVPTYNKELAVIKTNENVCVSECFKKWDRLFFDYKQSKIFADVTRRFNITDYDCIHAYTLFTDGNTAMRLSSEYGIPYVVAVRNTDVNDFFRLMPHLRGRGIKIMKNASAIFFLSQSYKKQVFDKYVPEALKKEFEAKSHIIPNGIDDFWFENKYSDERRISSKKVRLVYAGRIDKNKNILTIQRAVGILRQKGYDATLTVIGKIVDKKEFNKICKDSNTEYISAQPKEELIKYYRESDIFVMPSYTESFGLVYVEALSQGLPVVYTKGQGFDGQFSDGEVGYSVDAASSQQVADAIEKIICRYNDITYGLTNKADRYNWENICEKYSDLYKRLV